MLLARGDALLRAGEPAAAREAFDRGGASSPAARDDAGLLGEAALGFAGLGIAIVGLDAEAIARLEEALETRRRPRSCAPASRPASPSSSTTRPTARARRRSAPRRSRPPAPPATPRALTSALNARHVALWRPDRVEERLATAADMIAAAREAGERHAELQARNWRVTDLFELGDMPACREEIARHARLADELRLPSFQWYTPLWAAVEALLAGRFDEAERAGRRGRGAAACARATATPSCSPTCSVHRPARARRVRRRSTSRSSRTRSPTRPPARPTPPPTPGCSPSAARPTGRARRSTHAIAHPHAFDANWMSAQAECAEACVAARRRHPRRRLLRAPAALRRPARDRRPRGRQLRRRRPPPRRPRRAARPPRRRRAPPARRDRAQRRARLHRLGRARRTRTGEAGLA